MKDKENLKIHWEHTSNLYADLSAYLRFMVYDGNIEEPAYNMMMKTLDDLFNQYREIYYDLENLVANNDEKDEKSEV
jgi:hypothetical protein